MEKLPVPHPTLSATQIWPKYSPKSRRNAPPMRFVEGSGLRFYLAIKDPEKNFLGDKTTTLNEVLQSLRNIISSEKLYDSTNPAVIIPDTPLAKELDVKALHLTNVRPRVLRQLLIGPSSQELLPRGNHARGRRRSQKGHQGKARAQRRTSQTSL